MNKFTTAILEAAGRKGEPFIQAVRHFGYKVVADEGATFSLNYRPAADGPTINTFISALNTFLKDYGRNIFSRGEYNGKYVMSFGQVENIYYELRFLAGSIFVKRLIIKTRENTVEKKASKKK